MLSPSATRATNSRLGLAERLAAVIPNGRDQSRVTHLLPDVLRARIFAIACGYEDADDLDRLRLDPAFKLDRKVEHRQGPPTRVLAPSRRPSTA